VREEDIVAKILTDKEMLEIVTEAVTNPGLIDCSDSYRVFMEGLSNLICDTFGGEPGEVAEPDMDLDLPWTVGFHINELVPANGGVYRRYDKDVTWKDGQET